MRNRSVVPKTRGLRRHLALVAVPSVVAISLAACGGSGGGTSNASGSSAGGSASAGPGGGTTMTVAFGDPANQPANAPLYSVPTKEGYFKQEDIVGKFLAVDSATTSMGLLANGDAQISITGLTAVAAAYQGDPDLRIVAIQGGNIWKIGVPKDSKIKSLKDLKGARIGVGSTAASAALFAKASLSAVGLTPADYTMVPAGVAAQAAAAFKAHQIDAYASYYGGLESPFLLAGLDYRALPSPLDDLSGLTVIVTTKQMLAQHRGAVLGWLRAWIKATVFSAENPAAATRIHFEENPSTAPSSDIDTAVKQLLPTVKNYLTNAATLVPGEKYIGMTKLPALQKTVDFLANNGILKESFDVTRMTDLSLVPEANSFDKEKIKAEAQAAK